jgi:hypothetical protein
MAGRKTNKSKGLDVKITRPVYITAPDLKLLQDEYGGLTVALEKLLIPLRKKAKK